MKTPTKVYITLGLAIIRKVFTGKLISGYDKQGKIMLRGLKAVGQRRISEKWPSSTYNREEYKTHALKLTR
ncbi:MAG: hypothetical protein IJQ47_03110 [Synergistaceae bacterium]|nr:hypothetical protein [Synergistaceae bacterium]